MQRDELRPDSAFMHSDAVRLRTPAFRPNLELANPVYERSRQELHLTDCLVVYSVVASTLALVLSLYLLLGR